MTSDGVGDVPAERDGNDEVGYGKPPRQNRFQPGRSGNPRGRPAGARGIRSDLDAVLKENLTIQINGKSHKGTPQALALKTMAIRAATGDKAAIKMLIELTLQVFGAEDRGAGRTALSSQDQTILASMLALFEGEPPNAKPDGELGAGDDPQEGDDDV